MQIELAFAAGYDPALELASHGKTRDPGFPEDIDWDMDGPWTQHLRRKEQDLIDSIVHGAETGHYYVVLGPKVRPGCIRCRTIPNLEYLPRARERLP